MTIYFDMDGTLADLYGVDNWLECLRASDPYPYEAAKPLLRMATLAALLNRARRNDIKIAVLSWMSKEASPDYEQKIMWTKYGWLRKHLPSVSFDAILIVPYGVPKGTFCSSVEDILFDDEKRNRDEWPGKAYDETEILEVLKELLKK